ncbi:MAG: carbohydrate binding family 9 domain-containing protein [Kangiellaceae bacterium]|nr:carbohydrate binding family 9 domain-containing protein [Kangiellaceae bacterium]
MLNKTTKASLYLATSLLIGTSFAAEQNKQFSITRLQPQIEINVDGKLDETIWQELTPIGPLHQVKPQEFAEASQKTEIRVAYNQDYLFIAATLFESDQSLINAGQLIQGRDYEFDDQFHVVLDTFKSERSGYFFQLNPNGIRREALIDNQNFHGNWTTIWQGKARISEHGWTLEIAIPFKSLSFDPNNQQWGINFGRVIKRKGEVMAWSSRGADSWEMAPAVAGAVTGIKDIERGLGLDIKTSVTASRTHTKTTDENELEPSVDVFYKPSSDLTVSATFNTDFSATEVDDRVINLSRFSVFLPEKRDFFLQDMDIFEFGNIQNNGRPFFSRTIGLDNNGQPIDLNIGTKITGRNDSYSYGLLGVQQENTLGEKQEVFVGRFNANVLDESSIGLISTYGNPFTGENDSLLGADFNYRNSNIFDNKIITGGLWYQRTETQGLNGDNQAYGASLNYPNDDINIRFSNFTIEQNFMPAMGFVNRRGIRESNLGGGFQKRFKDSFWRSYYPWIQSRYVTDLDNRMLSRQTTIYPTTFQSNADDYFETGYQMRSEVLDFPFEIASGIVIPAGKHDFNAPHVFMMSSQSRPLSAELFYRKGDFFTGKQAHSRIRLNWRPNKYFYLSGSYDTQNINLPEGSFRTELMSLHNEVAFNSEWSWLTTMQYDNFSNSIGTSSRLRWQPDALSSLTFIYNSTDYKDSELSNPVDQNRLSIKYSYIFRL